MKKNKIIFILVAIFIIIGIVGCLVIFYNKQNDRNYEIEKIAEYKYFVLKENEKYGVINTKGEVVINAIYDDVKIPNPQKDVFICYDNQNIKVYNSNNEEILKKFEKVEPLRLKNISGDLVYEKSVLKYSKDDKYGIINFDGKIIAKAIYDDIDTLEYKEGELLVKQNEKYGIINIKGKTLVQIGYDKIQADGYYMQDNGYKKAGYIVSKTTNEGYRYGYVGFDGKEYLPIEFNEISRINQIESNDIYLICAKNGKYGLYKNDRNIIANDYQGITYNYNNILVVQKVKRYGVLSLQGKDILPIEYSQIDIRGKYLYAKNADGITNVFNCKGEETNIHENDVYIDVPDTNYVIYIDTRDNKTIYNIYKDGNLKTSKEYKYIEYLFDDTFIVSDLDDKIGIIDSEENIKINIEYSSVQKIRNTKIIQAKNLNTNKIELYNSNFDKISDLQNPTIETYETYIKVYNENETQYFSLDGTELKNTDIYTQNKIFAKKVNNLWGFVDVNENTILDFKYNKVTEINKYGFAGIYLNEKWGVLNSEGQVIVEPTYKLENEPKFIGQYYEVIYGNGEIYYTK